jgi:FAD/FMN-containing dehydrogenase
MICRLGDMGGYGPFAANYRLGVDQILGAKIANYKGDIVKADESMLRAIRGGGGAVGVICELTIKMYPLE